MRAVVLSAALFASLLSPVAATPAAAQSWHDYYGERQRDRDARHYDDGYDDGADEGYASGYDDGESRGYDSGYHRGRRDSTVTHVVQECKRRNGNGTVIGALAGGVLGRVTSDRNELRNTAIGAVGGGLLGHLVGKRGTDYDC